MNAKGAINKVSIELQEGVDDIAFEKVQEKAAAQ